MTTGDVFHPGEITVQVRAGERAIAKRRESMLLDRLNDAARDFVARQGVVAVGAAAPDGSVWASLWCGAPGFLRANAAGDWLEMRRDIDVDPADPVRPIVRSNEPLGGLVIDLETRRRHPDQRDRQPRGRCSPSISASTKRSAIATSTSRRESAKTAASRARHDPCRTRVHSRRGPVRPHRAHGYVLRGERASGARHRSSHRGGAGIRVRYERSHGPHSRLRRQ